MSTVVWLLRVALLVQALVGLGQPLLAGSFLSGNYDALEMHGRNGSLLPVLAMPGAVLALALALVGGRLWPLVAQLCLFFGAAIQVGMGHQRNLLVHIPLGTTLVGLLVALAVWSWLPRARSRRTVLVWRRSAP